MSAGGDIEWLLDAVAAMDKRMRRIEDELAPPERPGSGI